ncbi:MAG: ParB/RepB/Spo0J family partition protein [Bacteroidetes bacterium]|nr:ParB/RepB/Spo0J family partition protein [Bacteroidota bacterium]MBK9399532.1 ParB/RepB/Spo0J family partition protein [Bacteroidota bacterium]
MSTKKSALGKGLSALLEGNITPEQVENAGAPVDTLGGPAKVMAGNVALINLNQIEANPFQPRTEFDESALKELAESIQTQGIIQPITVRKMGPDKYQIISGERRYKASRLAGLTSIPAYVRTANDQSMLEMALVENIQRENLNALEIAISYQRLIEECQLTQEGLGERVGKDRSTVTNYLRLLKLPPQIQFAIRDGRITMGHARAILGVDDIGMQLKIFNDILENDLSVRKVENLVRQNSPKKSGKKENSKASWAVEVRNLEDRLEHRYETKVEIKHKDNGSGQILINYFSNDDLNRLMDLLDFD